MGRFAYYDKLKSKDRKVYERSDAIGEVKLENVEQHRVRAERIAKALEAEDRAAVQRASQALADGILHTLGAPRLIVRVLARRPRDASGELHGLYTLEPSGRAQVEVWMRTAANRRVVAFRTFLRTLVHELCHHIDLTHLGLADTFHTEGFFRRESSIVRQILGPRPKPAPKEAPAESPARSRTKRSRSRQLNLFD